ncbi:hypothetical protein [Paraburkholderia susongensis]|nr:hypothetical protein [Paraburkholderia susongensis]
MSEENALHTRARLRRALAASAAPLTDAARAFLGLVGNRMVAAVAV